jgi:hypothetical protein
LRSGIRDEADPAAAGVCEDVPGPAQFARPHFIKLLLLKRPLLREFYAQTCRIEKWSVRELECRIDSMQFERTAYKRDQVFQVPQIQRDHLSWQGEPGYFWLKDDSLDNLDNLPPPAVLQQEIIEHLKAALRAFKDVAAGLAK